MGDNIFLGDRDGVRTPMQWTGDRNGGFCRADFAQLYAPPLMDPVFGFQAVNVEAQLRTPTSLLRWMHRFIALRKEHPVFGLGTYEPIQTSNPRIFAVLRRFEDDLVLCVHNLARSAQAVELDLSAHAGRYPVELFGRSRFPRIGDLSVPADARPARLLLVPARRRGRGRDRMTENVTNPARAEIERLDLEHVAAWLEGQRWYASKSRHVTGLQIDESVAIADRPPLIVNLVQARFATGSHELYQLPLALLAPDQVGARPVVSATDDWVAVDAVADPELVRELLRQIHSEHTIEGDAGTFHFQRVELSGPLPLEAPVRPMGVEQSNSSIVFGDQTVLKVFRRLEPGINPELEVLRFLTRREFTNIAPLQGWYEYDGRSFGATLGVAQRFFADAVGGWELALDQIASDPAAFLPELGSLGVVTAQLHNCLASDASDPAFSPEEPSAESMSLLTATIDEDIERVFVRLPDDERVAPIAGRGQDVREQIAMRAQAGTGGRAIRTHGDYHLGQTLHLGETTPPPGGGVRLDHHRLRGRAGPASVRAPPEAQPAARRGRDAAVAGLRHLGHEDHARNPRAGHVRGTGPRHLPGELLRHDRLGAAARRRGGDPEHAGDLRAREGHLRAPVRARQPTGLAAHSRRGYCPTAGGEHDDDRQEPTSKLSSAGSIPNPTPSWGHTPQTAAWSYGPCARPRSR